MTAKVRIVRVKIEDSQSQGFVATSPDEHGLLVVRNTLDDLFNDIPQALADLSAARGEKVITLMTQREIDPATGYPTMFHRFSVIPIEMLTITPTQN
jgi:predicted RNase H-like HicB family nuclease